MHEIIRPFSSRFKIVPRGISVFFEPDKNVSWQTPGSQTKERKDSVQGSAPEDDKPLEFFGKSNY